MDDFSLLSLQLEWGADEALDLEPIDRLRPVETRPKPAPVVRPQTPMPEAPRATAGERALMAAARASTLDELRAAILTFDGCPLRDTATNTVFAEGNPESDTILISDPPGRDEDRGGHPFAGPEGQLLDEMLISIGLTRTDLMLAPMIPWRPPGGRPPSPAEVAICLPFLHRLITLLKPLRIVVFGGIAAKALLPQGTTRRRGQRGWIEITIPGLAGPLPGLCLPAMAELIKTPPTRRDAWAGFRLLRRTIDQA